MGKALIRMHVLWEFAERYKQWKQNSGAYPNDTGEIMVPLKLLRMAHEIIEENDKLQIEKDL